MALSLQLFDATPDAPLGTEPPLPRHLEAGLLDRLLGPALQSVDRSAQAVVGAAESGLALVRHPGRLVEMAGKLAGGTGALVGELLKPADPRSPLKGEFGLRKRVAWSEPVSIEEVKAIGRKCDAKVNDVLVAAMSAALGAYLSRRGVDLRRTRLHAMVPVDLRPRGRALELGNDFGLVILELATGTESPLDRVRLSILSYAGVATVAVIADAHLVPDPEAITGRFSRELARMLARSRAR